MEKLTRNEMIEFIKKDALENIEQEILTLCNIFKENTLNSEEIITLSLKISERVNYKKIISNFNFNQKYSNQEYILGEEEIKLLYKARKNYALWQTKLPLFFQVDCNFLKRHFNIFEYIYDLDED